MENRMKTTELAKRAGITVQAVTRRRRRGESDEQIAGDTHALPCNKPHGQESIAEAQRRKEIAAASLKELELAKQRGGLIEVDVAVAQWSELLSMARMRLTTMPTACADRLAAITDPVEVRAYLAKEIADRLGHLTDDFRTASIGALEHDHDDDDTADETTSHETGA